MNKMQATLHTTIYSSMNLAIANHFIHKSKKLFSIVLSLNVITAQTICFSLMFEQTWVGGRERKRSNLKLITFLRLPVAGSAYFIYPNVYLLPYQTTFFFVWFIVAVWFAKTFSVVVWLYKTWFAHGCLFIYE